MCLRLYKFRETKFVNKQILKYILKPKMNCVNLQQNEVPVEFLAYLVYGRDSQMPVVDCRLQKSGPTTTQNVYQIFTYHYLH